MSSEKEVKEDVRSLTGYTSTNVLTEDGLDTAYRRAKRHIRVQKSLPPDFTYFGEEKPEVENGLFWWTCLFAKVETGELDSQTLQAGAVDKSELLAKDDNSVTTWYRQAQNALDAISAGSAIQSSAPSRTGREYSVGNFTTGDNSGGSGSNVDAGDLG
jgi:hypothetical protein